MSFLRVCPIFQVSNVKGTGLDLLKSFFNIVPATKTNCENGPIEFQIDDTYWVVFCLYFLVKQLFIGKRCWDSCVRNLSFGYN